MEEFKELELARLQCFKQCKGHKVKVQPELQDDEELQFFNNVITRAWCIRRCEEKVVGLTPWGGVSHYVLDQLKAKEGYNYIQMSLYQVRVIGGVVGLNGHNMYVIGRQLCPKGVHYIQVSLYKQTTSV